MTPPKNLMLVTRCSQFSSRLIGIGKLYAYMAKRNRPKAGLGETRSSYKIPTRKRRKGPGRSAQGANGMPKEQLS